MIRIKDSPSVIPKVKGQEFPLEQLEELRALEEGGFLYFDVPDMFESNKEKAIYKIGFLSEFLKKLYPDEPYRKIIKIMNDRYQIFLGQRQIERNVKEYLENDIYR